MGGRGLQEVAQPADEPGVVAGELAVAEVRTGGADPAGPLQQREGPGGEAGVAGVDRILRVADKVREAELVAVPREARLPA